MMRRLIATLCALAALSVSAQPLPRVDEQVDPANSYWDAHVHYAYLHQYAKVADTQGVVRELAYLDLYRGKSAARERAPVLVLIHGRTMHSGYWGHLIEAPLAAGYRVISIDWTNTGKSLRPNLDKLLTRTLDDVRHMIHALVTQHLGIARASYLGHSLGGQVVGGYILDYPEAVERAVLYAPGGLEGFPGSTPRLIGWLAHNDTLFNLAWQTQALPDIGSTSEKIRNKFYSTRRQGMVPYLQVQDELGRFMVASHASALRGNPVELERFRKTHAWDTLCSLLENGIDNPRSVRNRLHQLKVPTLIVYGQKDPAAPIPGSGNDTLDDILRPLARRAEQHETPLHFKLYENGGHFLHTDFPQAFAADVLQFLRTGRAPEPLYHR